MPSIFHFELNRPSRMDKLLGQVISSAQTPASLEVSGFVGKESFSGTVDCPSIPRGRWGTGAIQLGSPLETGFLLHDQAGPGEGHGDLPSLVESRAIYGPESPLFGTFILRSSDGNYIGRDVLGTRPLFSGKGKGTAFGSEPRVLKELGFGDIRNFPPGKILDSSGRRRELSSQIQIPDHRSVNLKGLIDRLYWFLESTPSPRAIFFSGGIDSLILAKISEETGETILITAGVPGCKDFSGARAASKILSSDLQLVKIDPCDIPNDVDDMVPIIHDQNKMNLAICLPILHAAGACSNQGIEHAITGQGADELFGGYHKYLSKPKYERSMFTDLFNLHERGMDACDLASRARGVRLFLPYLDREFIKTTLHLPPGMKIDNDKRKVALRKIAKKLDIPQALSSTKKRAMQYGSGVNKYVKKYLRRNGTGKRP